jgi:hypothetical protein
MSTDTQTRLEAATAQLLIEIAFLLPRGTNVNEHSIRERLTEFRGALVAQEREGAVERERKAWDAAMAETWQMLRLQYPGATMDGSHVPLSLRKWAERMDAERDRRYPLPKEEGR